MTISLLCLLVVSTAKVLPVTLPPMVIVSGQPLTKDEISIVKSKDSVELKANIAKCNGTLFESDNAMYVVSDTLRSGRRAATPPIV